MNRVSPTCRSCGVGGLRTILDMGHTPLANALLRHEDLDHPEPAYPLEFAFCPNCTLVQILETVPPEKLYRDYVYYSSFSETMLSHAHTLAQQTISSQDLDLNSLVIEAASNDGYLLKSYLDAGIPVLGIEPAINIATIARERHGIPTRPEFFTESLGRRLREEGISADVFHAHNVLAHVDDLNGFVKGIAHTLKDTGVAIIEVPYIKDLIDRLEFDTIYHEHLCYFSLTALVSLFRRHELLVCDAENISIHGGSVRLYLTHRRPSSVPSIRVQEILQAEQNWGVNSFAYYERFSDRVKFLKKALCAYLANLKNGGNRIAAYGASAKGSTLLNYLGIGRETLDFIVDRNTFKQNRYSPGAHLPIHAPENLLKDMPDYVLLLTWNFAEEILKQQSEYRRRGGSFIYPLPEIKVA